MESGIFPVCFRSDGCRKETTVMPHLRSIITLLVCLVCVEIVRCDVRTKRTLPFDFSPSNWSQRIASFLPQPRAVGAGIFSLIAGPNNEKMSFVFQPDDGPRLSAAYQAKFGVRGERLIDALGSGLKTRTQERQPAAPTFVQLPPSPFSQPKPFF